MSRDSRGVTTRSQAAYMSRTPGGRERRQPASGGEEIHDLSASAPVAPRATINTGFEVLLSGRGQEVAGAADVELLGTAVAVAIRVSGPR